MIKSVTVSEIKEGKHELRIEGIGLRFGEGIAGGTVYPLSKEDLLILADEIQAQVERKR